MDEKRRFTTSEANLMIPIFEQTLSRIMQMNRGIQGILSALKPILENGLTQKSKKSAISLNELIEHLTEADVLSLVDIDQLTDLKLYITGIQEEISRLQDLGCTLSDLELGQIDLPAQLEGEEPLLYSWRLGEKAIEYWRCRSDQLNSRRPLNELPQIQEDGACS